MEIARAAAGLFMKRGLRATRAEDIAQAAGIAPRTFYRYFATKEEAVAPLYAAGADRWSEAVRTAPPELPISQALEHAAHQTLTPDAAISAASWEWVRTLVRLANSSPALRKVWAEVCHEAETSLAQALAARAHDNVAEAPLRFAAAVAAASVRVAVETWAAGDAPAHGPEGPAALAMHNLSTLRDFPWEAITAT
ncbi:TetR family transcriptional regulator [Streptomyces viridochromogenes]|uniref:TetR family transcriptional regulator n=1 Tax=Streptomyces viridochromogenes TaxID=1938 RepID=A0A0J7Z166_STRVR|nr:TetR family transcriptional regulator [Streptomyces viridochromogenes]KMS69726.1 TetR family transcriptional regulator [Streptomyces viridochromogenes]KOG14937.1 TetR family transcriptional regulator [Streptomyces viridochromogenes]KOG15130.1 TetR family transcriptional regulator [Streptomyces viridochromogenes]